jgi:hypothetical protein
MGRVGIVLFALALFGSAAAAAGSPKEVPFRIYRSYAIVVRGSIGSLKNLNFLVDTAAVPSMLDWRIARKLHLAREAGQMSVLTRNLQTERAIAPDVELGPLHTNELPVVVEDLSFAEADLGTRLDAIVGFDFLGQLPFTIDYESKMITYGPIDPSFATIKYVPGLSYVLVEFQIRQQKLALVVDTAASDLILFESAIRACISAIKITGVKRWSNLGGEVTVSEALLTQAYLGTMPWDERTAYILENDRARPSGVSGLLGVASLKTKRVAFDPNRKLLAWERTREP